MNTELLEKVKAHILEEPLRLDMNRYMTREHPNSTYWDNLTKQYHKIPACGSVGCIAGWGVRLGKLAPPNYDIASAAVQLFDITKEQGMKLFFLSGMEDDFYWPAEFELAYLNATSAEERARITAARIDHFIKTNGEE